MAVEVRELGSAASRLLGYAVSRGLVADDDRVWAYNRLLEAIGATGPGPEVAELPAGYDFETDLTLLAEAGVERGQAEDSTNGRDRLTMRLMGVLMPRPSELASQFDALVAEGGPKAATDWFYQLCVDVDYVRASAIARNLVWETKTAWGDLEITINKSKPEKDPRDIAVAGAAPVGEVYPACQLCIENEGYGGRPSADPHGMHPARQNLRIIPIELGGERWGFQYSPYAYFNEHCIAMSSEHRPMHVDRKAFGCLLDFVDLFPHYFIGSNADLPIVGGSILSHDHFQGGRHEFPMERAEELEPFVMAAHPDVSCCVLRWPLSVLRLRSTDRDRLLAAAEDVRLAWIDWDAPEVGIVSHDADGTRHNTVTPICRMRGDAYELDLALRCNVTTVEHPLGVFHPHEDKWHVKRENIGLIEVMGLAILPPRLEAELEAGTLTQEGIGRVFAGVLEDAGVFKWDEEGRTALHRFIASLEGNATSQA